MRGLDDRYGRCDEIFRDILNRKLKILQNRKSTESETEENDDDEDDEEMPEETGTLKIYDTSERDGRHASIRTNPEEDTLQIHTDGDISGMNLETNIRRSNRNTANTAVYHIPEFFGSRIIKLNLHCQYYR